MPALCPAGTYDRPPLPLEELDPPAWVVLSWRQSHLPLGRLKRQHDWFALSSFERRAAWQTAGRQALDDDQRYSLLSHDHDRVEALAHEARPDLVETRQQLKQRYQRSMPRLVHQQRPRAWRRIAPNFMVGWPTWVTSGWRVNGRDRRYVMTSVPGTLPNS
jgi:hypothetical protein